MLKYIMPNDQATAAVGQLDHVEGLSEPRLAAVRCEAETVCLAKFDVPQIGHPVKIRNFGLV